MLKFDVHRRYLRELLPIHFVVIYTQLKLFMKIRQYKVGIHKFFKISPITNLC